MSMCTLSFVNISLGLDTALFTRVDAFAYYSELDFRVDSSDCITLIEARTDDRLPVTQHLSVCKSTAQKSPVPTTPPPTGLPSLPTETPSFPHIVSNAASTGVNNYNQFWLHSFWGKSLIGLIVILAVLCLGNVTYRRYFAGLESTEGERMPILNFERSTIV
jgi:hypothetical protein